MKTVTARLVGAEMVVRMGGSGAVVQSPELAADALLRDEQVRMPAGVAFAKRVRRVIGERSLAGQGPSGEGVNWG